MSSTLAEVWSLDLSPTTIARSNITRLTTIGPDPGYDLFFLNNLLYHRWCIRYLAHLLSIVPHSEKRLRNDGILVTYQHVTGVMKLFELVAQRRGITVPPVASAHQSIEVEAKVPLEALRAEIEPHVEPAVKELMDLSGDVMGENGVEYHWTSVVALFWVGTDIFPATFKITLAGEVDESLAPLKAVIGDPELVECPSVFREESFRLRKDGDRTGWREEEAKGLVDKEVELFKSYWSIGEGIGN